MKKKYLKPSMTVTNIRMYSILCSSGDSRKAKLDEEETHDGYFN